MLWNQYDFAKYATVSDCLSHTIHFPLIVSLQNGMHLKVAPVSSFTFFSHSVFPHQCAFIKPLFSSMICLNSSKLSTSLIFSLRKTCACLNIFACISSSKLFKRWKQFRFTDCDLFSSVPSHKNNLLVLYIPWPYLNSYRHTFHFPLVKFPSRSVFISII